MRLIAISEAMRSPDGVRRPGSTNGSPDASTYRVVVIDAATIDAFAVDGGVAVRGVLDTHWIESLREAMPAILERSYDPLARTQLQQRSTARPRVVQSDGMWRDCEPFRRMLFESPIGAVAATTLGSATVRVYEDLMLYREPGLENGAPGWHRDAPYWPVTGRQLVNVWFSLERVTAETGAIRIVAGSHLDPDDVAKLTLALDTEPDPARTCSPSRQSRATSCCSIPALCTAGTARHRIARDARSRSGSWATTCGGVPGRRTSTSGCASAVSRMATRSLTLASRSCGPTPWLLRRPTRVARETATIAPHPRIALDIDAYVEQVQADARQGKCFICSIVAGERVRPRGHCARRRVHRVLSRFPTLYGTALLAPVEHRINVMTDFTEDEYVDLQRRIHRLGIAIAGVVPTERLYVLSLGSHLGNSHVHWHIAPLPPGVAYQEQQYAALMHEDGYLDVALEEQLSLARRVADRL